ncbi:MAG: T9SS type A sorting domain-containing protein [Bacteroidaceae bacterium]|nr:T9SS type A sorting domain-containing protein [Bacteroidaceae bacterium]
MKNFLLSSLLMLLGMSAFAQSGWTNPSGNYQLETVVYAAVDCGDYGLYGNDALPEVAAFVNGELRAVVSEYTQIEVPAGEGRIYTIRVGGEASDNGKTISFKLYDPKSGLIYPLSGPTVTWTGDNTPANPSDYYTLTASPAVEAAIFTKDENGEEIESPNISMRVGDRVSLDGYYVRFYDSNGKETTPENTGVWTIGGANAPYVEQVSTNDGSVIIQGIQETPDNDGDGTPDFVEYAIMYNVGSFSFNIPVQVLEEYIPVTSIAIEDYNYYWPGYGRLSLTDENVTYNNGESIPTYPGVRIISSSNPDVVELVQNYLEFHKMGTSTITVVAEDNPEVTTTFNVNILSALTSMETGLEGDTYEYIRNSSEEEEMDYPLPVFNWVSNEDGLPIIGNEINEEFTMVSDNPGVVRIDEIEGEAGTEYRVISVKKGTANITCTSVYDPTKSITYKMVVKQAVNEVIITEIDGVAIDGGMETLPEVEIIVGKIVTAKAVYNPADADYENFTMQFVNANWGEIEGAEQYVKVIGSTVVDGVLTFQFQFNAVPQEEYYLQAVIDHDFLSGLVKLNVVQKVESITLSETEKRLWINADESLQFYIDVKITPDNATNKRYTVESSANDVVSVESDPAGNSYNFYAIGKGEATLTFRSEDNPDAVATCVVTVKRRVNSIALENVPSELYNDGEPCNAMLVYSPSDADIDINALSYEIRTNGPSYPYEWSLMDITLQDAVEGAIPVEITPRSLCSGVSIVFSYDKSVEEESLDYLESTVQTSVCEKLTLGEGWNWISLISDEYAFKGMNEVLVEARSKNALVYNDPAWGLFGSLSIMGTNEAYKVNIMEGVNAYDIYLTGNQILSTDGSIADKTFAKGWNWVSYPYEYSYPVTEIFAPSKFAEGDVILSKSGGFVTLTDGVWEGTLSSLNPNEGYMIYSNNAQGFTLSMPGRFTLEQGYFANNGAAQAAAIERSVWNYDDSRFANTMAVIAKIDVDDCNSYTVGAFVGDECRGKGEFVNGKAYISVAGEMGEVVTFRLCDKWTGEFIDVTTELTFTDMAGTAKTPVLMGVLDGTTGIVDINSIDSDNIEAIYDAAGRAVSEMTEGIYILKVRKGDRVVTKKVRK